MKTKLDGYLQVRDETLSKVDLEAEGHLDIDVHVYRAYLSSDETGSMQLVWFMGNYDRGMFRETGNPYTKEDVSMMSAQRFESKGPACCTAVAWCAQKIGLGNPNGHATAHIKTHQQEQQANRKAAKERGTDTDGRYVKGEIEKMITICGKIKESANGEAWLQDWKNGEHLDFYLFYHKLFLEQSVQLACGAGEIGEDVGCCFMDMTFKCGNYYWLQVCHQFCCFVDKPTLPLFSAVVFSTNKPSCKAVWESAIKAVPMLAQLRAVACDLDDTEDNVLKELVPFIPGQCGYRPKCTRHAREAARRAATDRKEDPSFYVNQFDWQRDMDDLQWAACDKSVLAGEIRGYTTKSNSATATELSHAALQCDHVVL